MADKIKHVFIVHVLIIPTKSVFKY